MGKYPVHIDPWFINTGKCFDNGIRNLNKGLFPESTYGECLDNAVKAEAKRHNIDKVFI